MKFSIEELYFMYGQYDAFVLLQFNQDTKSFELFGKDGIMGRFRYTLEERKGFEKHRGTDNIPRTEATFKFIPSDKFNLSEQTQTLLDRDGLLCKDIAVVSSYNRKRENRFIVQGEKEIPDKLIITIPESNQREIDLMNIGMLKSRIKDGSELAYFEYFELYGLLLFYKREEVINNPELYRNFETKELKDEVKFHFLYCKYMNDKHEDGDIQELKKIKLAQYEKRVPIVVNEIKKNGLQISKLQDLEKSNFNKAAGLLSNIDDKLILPYPKPIWCDFERLAHIYLGHLKELYIGVVGNGNTFFQYNFKELQNVISNVLQIIYDEFIAEIKVTNRTFIRRGSRAVEFDGHYYRIELETNGRLLTFHPYNDDYNRENDN